MVHPSFGFGFPQWEIANSSLGFAFPYSGMIHPSFGFGFPQWRIADPWFRSGFPESGKAGLCGGSRKASATGFVARANCARRERWPKPQRSTNAFPRLGLYIVSSPFLIDKPLPDRPQSGTCGCGCRLTWPTWGSRGYWSQFNPWG